MSENTVDAGIPVDAGTPDAQDDTTHDERVMQQDTGIKPDPIGQALLGGVGGGISGGISGGVGGAVKEGATSVAGEVIAHGIDSSFEVAGDEPVADQPAPVDAGVPAGGVQVSSEQPNQSTPEQPNQSTPEQSTGEQPNQSTPGQSTPEQPNQSTPEEPNQSMPEDTNLVPNPEGGGPGGPAGRPNPEGGGPGGPAF
jgi:hypothetical protein